MHNITKIKLFRVILYITYIPSLVFILPFALLRKKGPSIFLFFDRYSIGGAQKVYLDILESLQQQGKQVYFTRRSFNDELKNIFFSTRNASVSDIHFWCDNLLFRIFTVHYFSFYINRYKHAFVLGSNSTFFYDMLPFLSKKHSRIELFHNFSYGKKGMEFFGLMNHRFLEHRILVDHATEQQVLEQYKIYQVPGKYNQRLKVIEPGVEYKEKASKTIDKPYKIFYAGRGGYQKRLWLMNRIAEKVLEMDLPFVFHFAGPVKDEFSERVQHAFPFYGNISSTEKLDELYRESHIIMLTSSFEGFPMFIKEGMISGCVPMVTALEGNKTHLKHMENALLLFQVNEEDPLVEEAINLLTMLSENPGLLQTLGLNAYEYARKHFDRERFIKQYQDLFQVPPQQD